MALETGTFISDLVATNPVGSDPLAFADDHIRLVKSTIKNTFPNISGAVTKTHAQINDALEKSGGTMTGALVLAGAPVADLNPATKKYVDDIIAATKQSLYPVGSIYVNATNSTNPSTLLGFGTWVEFGSGRVMVGQNASDTLFDTLEETGGSKDAIVVAHTHTATTSTAGAHSHTYDKFIMSRDSAANGGYVDDDSYYSTTATSTAGDHTHAVTVNSTGSSGTNANLQPYVVVKMWKRTA